MLKRRVTKGEQGEIVKMYQQGFSASAIGRQLGRRKGVIIYRLRKMNIPIRPNSPLRGKNPMEGGRITDERGYIHIKLYPDDFFYPMTNHRGYVMEHRLIIAKALNRCLLPWEVVHHKGTKYPKGSRENRSDNRYPENLQLLPSDKQHIVDRITRGHIARMEKRITLLETENALLKKQNYLLTLRPCHEEHGIGSLK